MSKERRQALRNQHGSMLRSSTCYNPNASKSTGSASPNSSSTKSSSTSSATSASNNSKSASNSDLDRLGPDDGKSLRRKVSNSISRSGSGLLSLRKMSGGSSPSPRSFIRAHAQPSGKYSPLQDEDDDEVENEYEEAPLPPIIVPPIAVVPSGGSTRSRISGNLNTNRSVGSNTTSSQDKGPEEEFKVTLRQRRREINNNFVGGGGGVGHPTSWRLSLSAPPEHFDDPYAGLNLNVNNINNSMRSRQPVAANMNANSNGYATPHDARPRPESWTPQPTVFYRTASLVPAQWMNPRDVVRQQVGPSGPASGCGGGGLNGYGSGRDRGHYNRASVMYCPSRVTSDVTFRKNVK